VSRTEVEIATTAAAAWLRRTMHPVL